MRRWTIVFILSGILIVSSACSRHRGSLDQAARLQKQGQAAKALQIYQYQFAHSTTAEPRSRAQLLFHIGECYEQLGQVAEAFGAYQQALDLDPENAQAHLRVGEIYLLAGEYERANQEATQVLRSPAANSADGFALLGAAAQGVGREDIAREAFQHVLQQEPGRVKVALALADLYNRAGDIAAAREVLKKISERQPASSLPWLALGRLEEQEGQTQAAEAAYRKAVALENTVGNNLRLAQFFERSGRVLEARVVLQRVDQMNPSAPTAVPDFNLSAGNPAQANDGYLAAVQASTEHSKDLSVKITRHELIARLIESDLVKSNTDIGPLHAAAIDSARQHLAAYGAELDEAERSLLQAEVALADDDLVQAAVTVTRALEKAPQSAAGHYLSGIVRYRSSDPASARSEWQQAIDLDGSFIPARIALAEESLQEHDVAGAQEAIVPVVRQEPSNIHALVIFGRSLIAEKAFANADNIATRIQALAPRSPYPHILKGEADVESGRIASALLEFQQAVLLDTHSRDAIDGLTKVYAIGHITRPMLLKMERVGMEDPRSSTLLEITGRNFVSLHLYADAERCLRESLAVDPARHSAAEWLARVQAQNGDLKSASHSVAGVREFSPMLAGVEAEQQHDIAAATENYDRAVRGGDPTGVAANNLAWLLAQQGRELDRALGLANKARELQPDNAAVLDTAGFVYLTRRDYSDAISVLEKAEKIASLKNNYDATLLSEIRHHLAEAYLRTGQTERAMLVASNRQH